MVMEKRRLGDILVESGKITLSALKISLNKQKILGKKLGEILISDGLLNEEDIIEVLEKQLGIMRINLDMISVDKRVIRMLQQSVCIKHELFPFEASQNKIKIAMVDPLNIFAVDDVSIATGLQVETYISTKEEIIKNIDKYYSSENVINAAHELTKKNVPKEIITEEIDDIKNAPAVKMVEYLIQNAIEDRASDIHIEPYEKKARVRYRIDGQLIHVSDLPIDALPALVTRIKILANLNIAEKRVPQDGRILTNFGGRDVDLRVSILPMITGEKIVIRILSRNSYNMKKDKLGMDANDLNKITEMIKSPHGIILVTGPTGSGKSTTLYTLLNELNNNDKNIVTIEDPVEYTLEGVNQVNVNTKAGLTFASGLRSILRQDPDIVMIGEIRDAETAQIGIRAAITGHLVLSTLHTNDAPSCMLRLIDMGIEPYLVSTAITGVIAQRLVRNICPKCKGHYKANNYEKKILGFTEDEELDLYKGGGCAYCNNTGYKGRRGIYEIMAVDREIKELMLNTKNSELLKDVAVKNGMKTLATTCKELVLKGSTTIDELINISFFE